MCCVVAALFTLGPRAAILFWWLVEPVRWSADVRHVPVAVHRLPDPAVDDPHVRPRLPGRHRRLRLRLARDRRRDGRVQLGRAAGTPTGIGSPRPRPDGSQGSIQEPPLRRAVGLGRGNDVGSKVRQQAREEELTEPPSRIRRPTADRSPGRRSRPARDRRSSPPTARWHPPARRYSSRRGRPPRPSAR